MKAVVFDSFGEPGDVLEVRDVPDPTPASGEVLVRMLASPVNPSDLMTVRGVYGKRPELPATPGYEGVGVVESSGGGILAGLVSGKRVAVLNGAGGNWAEKVVIPAQQAVPLPSNLAVEQAASFFVNPATAFVLTRRWFSVPKGDWLLQTAAGSALGRMVIRLGGEYGFRTLNVVRREEQVDELKSLGADEVVVFDPSRDHEEDFVETVVRVTGGGVKYAIDPVGGGTGSAVVPCLTTGGRLVVFGTLADGPLMFSSRDLMTPGASVEGFWLSNYMASLNVISKLALVRSISSLVSKGVLASPPGRRFPLEQVRDAAEEAERPGRSGKVLLEIAEK